MEHVIVIGSLAGVILFLFLLYCLLAVGAMDEQKQKEEDQKQEEFLTSLLQKKH